MSVVRFCEKCVEPIPQERLDILPDTYRCVSCSNESKTEGVLEYQHKTGGCILILPKDGEMKRRALAAYRRKR